MLRLSTFTKGTTFGKYTRTNFLGFLIRNISIPFQSFHSHTHEYQEDALYLELYKISKMNIIETRKFHCFLTVNGFFNSKHNPRLTSKLVDNYVNLGYFHEALIVFNHLQKKTVFEWNSILRFLVNNRQYSKTLDFYNLMLKEDVLPDNYTYPLVLKACSGLADLEHGIMIRNSINSNEIQHKLRPNIYVACALIDMFAKCGSFLEARKVFDKMSTRDLASWSAMISATVQMGHRFEAFSLFQKMRIDGIKPDSSILSIVLPASGRFGLLQMGMGLQGYSIRAGFNNDLFVSNALIDMYCKCGKTYEANGIFREMLCKDIVSWSSLIAGYSQNCNYGKSLSLYIEMSDSNIFPSPVTIASVLPSFANLKLIKQGKEIHNYVLRNGFEDDIFISSSLIDLYSKCGLMKEAAYVFYIMSNRDISTWNSMITAYALHDMIDSAFDTLRKMVRSEIRPNSVTTVSILPLCTRLGILRQGKEIHGCTIRIGLGSVVSVANSLADFYFKCGYLNLGMQVFENMIEKDIVTYNTMISGVGMHGHGSQAFQFFDQMIDEGVKPDKVTFVALLSACSHSGLVENGRFFFDSMTNVYGILPDMDHYSCMVDLFGRSGCLTEAWEFIKTMPVEPSIDTLGSLLAACRVHNRIDLAERVGKMIFDKNPDDPGYYVLLSNLYASSKRWSDVLRIRMTIREKGLSKKPGNSWIHVGSGIHSFVSKDRMHPEIRKIHENLKSLILQIKEEGYIPDTSFILHDVNGNDLLLTNEPLTNKEIEGGS